MQFDFDMYAVEDAPVCVARATATKTTKRESGKVKKKSSSPTSFEISPVKNENFNEERTYVLLHDGTYFEIVHEDASLLTDSVITEYIRRRFGNEYAKKMELFRPE